jgi:hypothetical protein
VSVCVAEKKLDILMEELFGRFDADGSGEFQFEEFRDFFTKLLANDDCLNTLRSYASHRFRDKLAEKRRNEIYEQVGDWDQIVNKLISI